MVFEACAAILDDHFANRIGSVVGGVELAARNETPVGLRQQILGGVEDAGLHAEHSVPLPGDATANFDRLFEWNRPAKAHVDRRGDAAMSGKSSSVCHRLIE